MDPEIAAPVEPQSTESATPEVAAPETPVEQPEDKARTAMQKRISTLTYQRAQEKVRADNLERQFRESQAKQPASQEAISEDVIEQRAEQKAAAREFLKECNTIAAQWKAESKDFEADRDTLSSMAGPLVEDGKPSPLLKAAMTTDAPAKMLAHLVANPDVLAEVAELPFERQVRKLALIESQMSTKPTRSPAGTPKPLEPVQTTTAASEPDPEKDLPGWIAMRNKRDAERRK